MDIRFCFERIPTRGVVDIEMLSKAISNWCITFINVGPVIVGEFVKSWEIHWSDTLRGVCPVTGELTYMSLPRNIKPNSTSCLVGEIGWVKGKLY